MFLQANESWWCVLVLFERVLSTLVYIVQIYHWIIYSCTLQVATTEQTGQLSRSVYTCITTTELFTHVHCKLQQLNRLDHFQFHHQYTHAQLKNSPINFGHSGKSDWCSNNVWSRVYQGEYATTYSSMAHTFWLNDVTSSVLVQTWYKVLSMNNIMSSQDNWVKLVQVQAVGYVNVIHT